jgi:hypothetical protein
MSMVWKTRVTQNKRPKMPLTALGLMAVTVALMLAFALLMIGVSIF